MNEYKNFRDFMDLPESERVRIVELYTKQRDILEQWHSINARMQMVNDSLKSLQAECTHPFATKIHKANTGNYSDVDNSYWTEFKCPDCGKFWTEEGSK